MLQESDEAACSLFGQFQDQLEEALSSGLLGSIKQ
jgi:hypothetical protein